MASCKELSPDAIQAKVGNRFLLSFSVQGGIPTLNQDESFVNPSFFDTISYPPADR